MKKKLLLALAVASVLVCLLAISVSAANVYYKDASGNTLFTGVDEDGNRIFESYTGSFPNTDEGGNALTWYITSTETVGEDTVHTVSSFQTIDTTGEHASLSDSGVYKYVNQAKELSIVSAYFPDNSNILTLSLSDNGYGDTYNFGTNTSKLLFLTLPNTLTALPSRIGQCTPIIDCTISDDAPIPSFGVTSFHGSKNLRSVDIPRAVTILYSNDHSNDGCTFFECGSLVDVDFAENSMLETIQVHAFYKCSALKEITIPNSVTTLQYRAFEGCESLETVRMGANVGKGSTEYNVQSLFYGCKALKYVYISDTVVPTSGSHMFANGANGMVFFYTGTYAQYESMKATLTSTGNNGKFTGATPIEWDSTKDDQYYKDLAADEGKNYVVYGYGRCEAFYGGHNMSEDAQMQFDSYFAEIKFGSVCTNDGCGHAGIDESKTLASIFVDYGYSCTEEKINGSYAVSQFFGINRTSLNAYALATGNTLEYGLVVSTVNNPLAEENSGLIAEGKTYITAQEKFAHDYFAINVIGITDGEEGTKDTRGNALTFCAYVIDNGKVYYLDGGKTLEVAEQKCYNDVLNAQ